jgi:predicted small metal-binding protein
MSKVLRCREVGLDCDFEARGETQQEVLSKAAEHARKDHGLTEIPPELMAKVQSVVHDQ